MRWDRPQVVAGPTQHRLHRIAEAGAGAMVTAGMLAAESTGALSSVASGRVCGVSSGLAPARTASVNMRIASIAWGGVRDGGVYLNPGSSGQGIGLEFLAPVVLLIDRSPRRGRGRAGLCAKPP